MPTNKVANSVVWFENAHEIFSGETRIERLRAVSKLLVSVFLFALLSIGVGEIAKFENLSITALIGMGLGFFVGLAQSK